jgi:hypothetical protein
MLQGQLENLMAAQPIKKLPNFMESEGSLACSQKLITGAYNEPAE